jgi:hypothetical protein
MSYAYAILRDHPIGFYSFDITLKNYADLSLKYATYANVNAAYATYANLSAGSTDSSQLGNNPTLSQVTGSSAINAGNQSSASISQTGSITINNKVKAFSNDFVQDAFSAEFWFSFNNLMNGQNGYYDWAVNNYPTNNSINDSSSSNINIFYINNGVTNIGVVFYEKITNSFKFRLYGAGGTYVESYCIPKELDTQYHIYISYKNKSISIAVNNTPGVSAKVTDTSLFASDYSTITYKIDGSTLKSSEKFSISNLAFYNYILSNAQIKNHMIWGFNDDKPIQTSTYNQNSFFTLQESKESYAYRKLFVGKAFNSGSTIYNLNVTDGGLNPLNLNPGAFNKLDTTGISYNATNGASWTGGKSGIDFSDFGKIATIPGTITLIVKPSVSNEYILSINKVNGNSTLYLERSSNAYRLVFYDVENGGTTTVLATSTATPAAFDNIALSFLPNSILLTINGVQNTISFSTAIDKSSTLTIGQSYHLGVDTASLVANSSSFASLSITDDYINSFPATGNVKIQDYTYSGGYPWTAILKFFAPLKSNLIIQQKGYWVASLPLTSVVNAVGSKIDWTSMNNCLVEYSTDKGNTWNCIPRRGSHIPGYNFSGQLTNILIRVTLMTNYQVSNYNQSFNELDIGIYKTLNLYSEGEKFIVTPGSRSANNSSYTTRIHPYQVISKSNNIGLLFSYDQVTSSVPGYAQVKNLNSEAINGVEFWVRTDSNRNNAKLMTGNSAISGYPDLYISSTGYLTYNSGISALYVNGNLASSGTFQIADNDIYHIVVATNAYVGDIFLNGTATNAGLEGSYGHINIWKYTPYSQDSLNRYNLFSLKSTTVYANDNLMNSTANRTLADLAKDYPLAHKIGV